jgi:hypothetical protein
MRWLVGRTEAVKGGQAPAPVLVVDEERHLGLGPGRPPVVAGHADELVVAEGHERHAVHVVDVGEVLDVGVRQLGPGREVAEVDALGRLAPVEVDDAGPVVGPDRPEVHGRAVGQHDVALPAAGVGRRDLRIARRDVVHRRRGYGAR